MQGPWYLPFSFPTTLFSISFIYLFRLPVLSEMGVNFRDRPRVYFTLMEENIYTEIVHVMQQIKGDKIWIFMGYRVPVLM